MKTLSLDACKELIDQHPHDPDAYHLAAILYDQAENDLLAIEMIKRAIALNPLPMFLLHYANILKRQKSYHDAEVILRELLAKHPTYSPAYNNLGTLYFAQNKFAEAIDSYQQAILIQDNYPDAYYNLGLALMKLSKHSEAEQYFKSVLAFDRNHVGARYQLIKLMMVTQAYQQALVALTKLIEEHPFHFESWVNAATCCLKLGEMKQAKCHYLKALELSSNDEQVLFNLGVIANQQQLMSEATYYFSLLVSKNPDHFDAQNNLAILYLMSNDRENALKHFQEAARIQPGNIAISHTIKIIMQDKTVTTTPLHYVEALFDSYADHYDAHLKGVLKYQFPDALSQRLRQYFFDKTHLHILELGCGTGLCAGVLKPYAARLVGIDVSSLMLDKAREKNQYDVLISRDIISYITENKNQYHLIVAGDVLNYFGELSDLMCCIPRVMRENGYFIFNVERGVDNPFELTPSGRFAHHEHYIRELAERNQLVVCEMTPCVLRMQTNQPVNGWLVVLARRGVN